MCSRSFAFLLMASSLTLAACTGEHTGSDPGAPEADLGAGDKAEDAVAMENAASVSERIDPELLGTFQSEEVQLGELMLIVLKADGTFHAGRAVGCTSIEECSAQEDGLYKLTYRSGGDVIELSSQSGEMTGRFYYELTGDTLRMAHVGGDAQWRTMERSGVPWCGVPEDCQLQNLAVAQCIGEWTCQANACSYPCEPHPVP